MVRLAPSSRPYTKRDIGTVAAWNLVIRCPTSFVRVPAVCKTAPFCVLTALQAKRHIAGHVIYEVQIWTSGQAGVVNSTLDAEHERRVN